MEFDDLEFERRDLDHWPSDSEAWVIIDAEAHDELAGPYDTRKDAEEAAGVLFKPGVVKVWPISL